jgi:regulator of replication initiation timing
MELKELEKRIEEALTELGALRKEMEKLEEENHRLKHEKENRRMAIAELSVENEQLHSMMEDLADLWIRTDLHRRKLVAKYEEGRELEEWEKR